MNSTVVDVKEQIHALETAADRLRVAWGDNHRSEFHFVWLRDNCTCQTCGDKSGGHRYLELNDIELDIVPYRVTIVAGNWVEIEWTPEGHRSRFAPAWLRAHCYSDGECLAASENRRTWSCEISASLPSCQYAQVSIDGAARLAMFERVHELGFVVIRGVGRDEEGVERIADLFGFIRRTHYGRVFELISTPEQRILAQTSHPILPHNDELFRTPIPGLLCMHCVQASADGGGRSVLVDGVAVANRLREEKPEAFELLARIALPHRRFLADGTDDVALAANWPAIDLDEHGEVAGVHVNERTMAPLSVPSDQVVPVYRALREFLRRLYDERAGVEFLLPGGDAVVFDNHRVLHARTGFAKRRHIRQCHVDRDEFHSRLRALRRRILP